jgi:hypothetical protein
VIHEVVVVAVAIIDLLLQQRHHLVVYSRADDEENANARTMLFSLKFMHIAVDVLDVQAYFSFLLLLFICVLILLRENMVFYIHSLLITRVTNCTLKNEGINHSFASLITSTRRVITTIARSH